jgi:putative PIN family toxin of toxin-antitoxin system
MIPLRLVIDTNVLVSAALKPASLERTVILLALARPARWYVTEPIMNEYASVLARSELKIRRGLRSQFLQFIEKRVHMVAPSPLPPIASDPGDNIFLQCADASRADYLVTGNLRHFPKFWKKTKIINSRELLDIVAPHLAG